MAALYLAQGIPWGFATITLAALLAEQGVDAGTIGNILAAVVLPWSLKFVGGPLVDGIRLPGGRRRPWILMAQLGMMATLFGLSREGLASPDQLTAWLLAHNVFAALQDVATDALAVDVMPDRERGRANGIMYGAKYGGTALGGAGLALLIQDFGWSVGTLVQAGVVGAIGAFPLFLREPNREQSTQSSTKDWTSALGELLRQRPFWWTLALCLMIGLPSGPLDASGQHAVHRTIRMDCHKLGRPERWTGRHRWPRGSGGWWLLGQSVRTWKNWSAGRDASCEHDVDFLSESRTVPQQRHRQPHLGVAIRSRGSSDGRQFHPRHACRADRNRRIMLHRPDGHAEPLHHQRVLGGGPPACRTKNRVDDRGDDLALGWLPQLAGGSIWPAGRISDPVRSVSASPRRVRHCSATSRSSRTTSGWALATSCCS